MHAMNMYPQVFDLARFAAKTRYHNWPIPPATYRDILMDRCHRTNHWRSSIVFTRVWRVMGYLLVVFLEAMVWCAWNDTVRILKCKSSIISYNTTFGGYFQIVSQLPLTLYGILNVDTKIRAWDSPVSKHYNMSCMIVYILFHYTGHWMIQCVLSPIIITVSKASDKFVRSV